MSVRDSLLIVVVLLASGCLAREKRNLDTAPVLSKDGQVSVAVERFRCTCQAGGGATDGGHLEGMVRARFVRGESRGLTRWVQPLGPRADDALEPLCVDCYLAVEIVGEGRDETVVVHACQGERRFKLATGDPVD
jgi:hypothetical protein